VKNAKDVMAATQKASQIATTPKERADIEHEKNEEANRAGTGLLPLNKNWNWRRLYDKGSEVGLDAI
jgi:hypothetical protein